MACVFKGGRSAVRLSRPHVAIRTMSLAGYRTAAALLLPARCLRDTYGSANPSFLILVLCTREPLVVCAVVLFNFFALSRLDNFAGAALMLLQSTALRMIHAAVLCRN